MPSSRTHGLATRVTAFGLTALLLAAVAVLGAVRVGAAGHDAGSLASHDLRAAALVGALRERSAATADLTARHLYVVAGDLAGQDAVQRPVQSGLAAEARDRRALGALVAGTPAAGPVRDYAAAGGRFAAVHRALARSRQETVAHAAGRGGSRGLYLHVVGPTARAAVAAGGRAGAAVERAAARTGARAAPPRGMP